MRAYAEQKWNMPRHRAANSGRAGAVTQALVERLGVESAKTAFSAWRIRSFPYLNRGKENSVHLNTACIPKRYEQRKRLRSRRLRCAVFCRLPSARRPANRSSRPPADPQGSRMRAYAEQKWNIELGASRGRAWSGLGWKKTAFSAWRIRSFPYLNRGKENSVHLLHVSQNVERKRLRSRRLCAVFFCAAAGRHPAVRCARPPTGPQGPCERSIFSERRIYGCCGVTPTGASRAVA